MSPPTLRIGDDGEWVVAAQRALSDAGALARTTTDGMFGPGTKADVRAFQRSRGLVPDGIVGLRTWAALGVDRVEGWTFDGLVRRTQPIAGVILHHTVTYSTEATIRVLRRRGLSTGYIVGPNGDVLQCCPDDRIAHHCLGFSARYIGIDVVNPLDIDLKDIAAWTHVGTAPFAPADDGHRFRRDTAEAVASTHVLCERLARVHGFPLAWRSEYPGGGAVVPEERLRAGHIGIIAHGQVSPSRWDGHAMLLEWDRMGLADARRMGS